VVDVKFFKGIVSLVVESVSTQVVNKTCLGPTGLFGVASAQTAHQRHPRRVLRHAAGRPSHLFYLLLRQNHDAARPLMLKKNFITKKLPKNTFINVKICRRATRRMAAL
jgi:hypothetical protein